MAVCESCALAGPCRDRARELRIPFGIFGAEDSETRLAQLNGSARKHRDWCPGCGQETSGRGRVDDKPYCPGCKKVVVAERRRREVSAIRPKCPNCTAEISHGAQRCGACRWSPSGSELWIY